MKRSAPLRRLALALTLALLSAHAALRAAPSTLFADGPRRRVTPLFDTPLRDTSICKAPDGNFYLTGTAAGPDGSFQNNDGVFLWKSADLKSWQHLGQVWSIEKHATEPQSAWQRERRVNPDDPGGPLVRGITSPEIHAFDGTFWIACSMNAQGTGLLKSTSGKPEGPYADLGCFTTQGTDASTFVDDDGTAYWVVGQGWVAPLKPDRSGLADHPRLLRCEPIPVNTRHGGLPSTFSPCYLGRAGAHLFKANGRYWLAAADVFDRIGVGCYDTFIAGSDTLFGRYTRRNIMIPHGGQTTVFSGPDTKTLYATFAPRDSRAALRDRPAAVPLVFGNEVMYGRYMKHPFPRIDPHVTTEFGPWDKVTKVQPYHIRDLQFSFAPDGFAYLTGSGCDPAFNGKIMLYRSKDMKNWEIVDVQFDFLKQVPGATPEDYELRFGEKKRRGLEAYYMDSEVYYLADTFHIFTSLYGMRIKRKDGSRIAGGSMWLRSTTGKPEGPYQYVTRARAQSSVFVDDDGTTYLFYNGALLPFDPRGDKLEGNATHLATTAGTRFAKGDVATNLLKIHGKYMVFGTGWCGGTYGENYRIDGTYDWVYWQSDTLKGPYTMPRRAYAMPHCGHSSPPLKGPDGRWYGLFFGNDSTGPWPCYPGVLVFDVRLDPDDTVRITLKEELP
jgi:beta-xylosidase